MKKLIAITALVSGILLILVPRYILPACEYEGFSRMHCSDTAQAEMVAGALLMVIGFVAFFLRSTTAIIACSCAAFILYGVSFWLPDKFGYCRSSHMPCNYGMVPGIRFIAIAGALIMIVAIINISRAAKKKGNS